MSRALARSVGRRDVELREVQRDAGQRAALVDGDDFLARCRADGCGENIDLLERVGPAIDRNVLAVQPTAGSGKVDTDLGHRAALLLDQIRHLVADGERAAEAGEHGAEIDDQGLAVIEAGCLRRTACGSRTDGQGQGEHCRQHGKDHFHFVLVFLEVKLC